MRENRPLKETDPLYLDRELELAAIHYARMYTKWRERYLELAGLSALVMDGMPKGSDVSRPTERAAIVRADLSDKMKVIEETAQTVAPEWPDILLYAVTAPASVPYGAVEDEIPVGRDAYNRTKRAFYATLAAKIF